MGAADTLETGPQAGIEMQAIDWFSGKAKANNVHKQESFIGS